MATPLPPGWRVTNNTGSHAGPPPRPDLDEPDDDDQMEDGENADSRLDIRPDSPGWEDMEDDSEQLNIKDFFSDQTFPTAKAMLDHCTSTHGFDFLAVCREHKLDFYSTIKLVNYIRTQALSGNVKPDVGGPSAWADDKFLQPALEDDPLLFCLDDVAQFDNGDQQPADYDERMALEAAKEQHSELDAVEE